MYQRRNTAKMTLKGILLRKQGMKIDDFTAKMAGYGTDGTSGKRDRVGKKVLGKEKELCR